MTFNRTALLLGGYTMLQRHGSLGHLEISTQWDSFMTPLNILQDYKKLSKKVTLFLSN